MPDPDELDEIILRYSLTAASIAKIAGVSERTAEKWVKSHNFPEPVRRVVLLVYGYAKPEDFRP